jgi:hypothetical protein
VCTLLALAGVVSRRRAAARVRAPRVYSRPTLGICGEGLLLSGLESVATDAATELAPGTRIDVEPLVDGAGVSTSVAPQALACSTCLCTISPRAPSDLGARGDAPVMKLKRRALKSNFGEAADFYSAAAPRKTLRSSGFYLRRRAAGTREWDPVIFSVIVALFSMLEGGAVLQSVIISVGCALLF